MEQYNVTGMSCAACSARVEKAVSKVPGVTACSVSLLTNSMGVEGTASPQEIVAAVQNAGYCPIVFDLDYSAGLPSVSRAVSAMQRATRGCTVLLGDDTSVQEDWTSLLTRLHANGLPITALNELSARGSAS